MHTHAKSSAAEGTELPSLVVEHLHCLREAELRNKLKMEHRFRDLLFAVLITNALARNSNNR